MATSDSFTPEQWARLAPRIDALLDTPPDERVARLAELSDGDPALAAVLRDALAECEREHPLLDQPAVERFAGLFDPPAPRFPGGLSERYRLVRELGRGGMATVFLARDLKHERDVAVKVMRPDLALGRERFLSEIRIVAGLRHPHIVPLFDSGDADGALYYVMPYEEGLSLRARLARDGRLPVADAVAVPDFELHLDAGLRKALCESLQILGCCSFQPAVEVVDLLVGVIEQLDHVQQCHPCVVADGRLKGDIQGRLVVRREVDRRQQMLKARQHGVQPQSDEGRDRKQNSPR